MVNVGGEPSGRSRETVTRQIQAAELVSVGQKCDLQLRIPGQHPAQRHPVDIMLSTVAQYIQAGETTLTIAILGQP